MIIMISIIIISWATCCFSPVTFEILSLCRVT